MPMLCLSLALSVLPGCCSAADVAAPAQTQQEVMVSVPLSRLIELQSLMNLQGQKITLLKQQLTAPQTTLKEQQNLISELKNNLRTAKSSLAKSEQIISEQNKSLTNLSVTLKQEQRRARRIERQRLLWQVIAGSAIVVLVK